MKSDTLLHQGEGRAHDQTSACWCKPIRRRYNSLIGRWCEWDGTAWSDLPDPQPAPPDGYQVPGGNVALVEVMEERVLDRPATDTEEKPL